MTSLWYPKLVQRQSLAQFIAPAIRELEQRSLMAVEPDLSSALPRWKQT